MQRLSVSRIYAVGLAYAYQEEVQPTGEPRRIYKPKNNPVTPYLVDVAAAIKKNENKNLSIHGCPGSGKTLLMAYLLTLFSEYQRVIFCFKSKDYYLTFSNLRLDVTKYLPDPFANPHAFLGAFMTAFTPDNVSLQTEEARNELVRILESVHNWDELKEIVRKGKQSSDSNLRNAYGIIGNAIGVIEHYQPHPIKFPKSDVVLDFTGFGDNKKAKVFYAELILRQIYTELVTNESHRPIIIAIDEAHRLFANGEKSETILKEIAKEGRQANACLWLSTQNYTEIPSKTISNFGFQFLFKTNEEDDLRAARAVADFLPYALTTLPDHMFISLRDHQNLEQYRCEILYYLWNNEHLKIDGSVEIEEIKPTISKNPFASAEEQVVVALDMLEKRPIYVTLLAAEFEKRYGYEFDRAKGSAMGVLRKIKKDQGNRIATLDFDMYNKEREEGEVLRVKRQFLYYKIGEGTSPRETQLHIWQQNWIAAECKRFGFVIEDEAKPDDWNEMKPDIIITKSGKSVRLEIETGLKHGNLEDLQDRIDLGVKLGQQTIIIVPNNDIRRYYAEKFPRALVTCFYPFINSLKVEQKPTQAADADVVEGGKVGGIARGEREEDIEQAQSSKEESPN